ncbi:helicase associated domain-containing protein [Streptomyces sp. NBC_00207]|uniref:helicase associated domain-containing protein n=1 Tax=Streptomyces sp. NBC_00207 TaxID=2903635 RepID=UPI003245E513
MNATPVAPSCPRNSCLDSRPRPCRRAPAQPAPWQRDRQAPTDAAYRYRQREGHLDVPYEHVEVVGAFPLGRWLSDQRRMFRAGAMTGERAAGLEELGIVWDTADHGFETNLAAARTYYELHGTLAAPRGGHHPRHPGRAVSIEHPPPGRAGHGPRTGEADGPRRSQRSPRTGTRGCWGGRSAGSGATPASPSSWPEAPA